MSNLLFKVVNLDGKVICYFETKIEAEKFIHDLDAVDEFRIEKVNPEKKMMKK